MNTEQVTIFLHVPKAAGSTLNRIFRRQCSQEGVYKVGPVSWDQTVAELKALTPEALGKLAVVTGHAPYGLHRALGKPCRYITILRDPVERALSHYYYAKRTPGHHAYEAIKSGETSAEKYLLGLRNQQTRYIAGGLEQPCGDAELWERAKSNLSENFAAVGLTERFDESLVLFARVLGWPIRGYRKTNVTAARPSQADTSGSLLEAIEENNQLDRALYEHAAMLLDTAIGAQGSGFRMDLLRLRWLNRLQSLVPARVWGSG